MNSNFLFGIDIKTQIGHTAQYRFHYKGLKCTLLGFSHIGLETGNLQSVEKHVFLDQLDYCNLHILKGNLYFDAEQSSQSPTWPTIQTRYCQRSPTGHLVCVTGILPQ